MKAIAKGRRKTTIVYNSKKKSRGRRNRSRGWEKKDFIIEFPWWANKEKVYESSVYLFWQAKKRRRRIRKLLLSLILWKKFCYEEMYAKLTLTFFVCRNKALGGESCHDIRAYKTHCSWVLGQSFSHQHRDWCPWPSKSGAVPEILKILIFLIHKIQKFIKMW